jgi:hypothetical protein
MLRGSVAILACLLGCAALTGCSPAATPAPSPTSTAIFASEDEALAAATAVYQQYTAAKDKESSNGDVSAESLRPLVTPSYFEELQVVGTLEENGWHTAGSTTFDTVSLVDFEERDRLATVRVSLCRDVSAVTILDSNGADVTPATRTDRFPLLIQLISAEAGSNVLLISDSGSWLEDDFC